MAKICSDLSKLIIFVIFVICTECIHAKSELNNETEGTNPFEFEQIKYKLFDSNIADEFMDKKLKSNDRKCLHELKAIREGLEDYDLWALKSKFLYFSSSHLSSAI